MDTVNKKTLVLNCASGISGDMTVAALLDLGADRDVLMNALESFHLEGARVEISRVKKSALDACDFNVVLDAEHENHDHDMAYLHPDRSQSRCTPMTITIMSMYTATMITIMSMHIATMITITSTHTAMTTMIMNITTITIMAGIWLTSRLSCAQAI